MAQKVLLGENCRRIPIVPIKNLRKQQQQPIKTSIQPNHPQRKRRNFSKPENPTANTENAEEGLPRTRRPSVLTRKKSSPLRDWAACPCRTDGRPIFSPFISLPISAASGTSWLRWRRPSLAAITSHLAGAGDQRPIGDREDAEMERRA